jgi:hypothetical protein
LDRRRAGEGRWEAGGLLGLLVEKEKVGRGKEAGPTGPKRREREGERFWNFFFFKLFFQTLQTSPKHKTMLSNYNAQAIIVSNIIEMIFKYFKGQIYLII